MIQDLVQIKKKRFLTIQTTQEDCIGTIPPWFTNVIRKHVIRLREGVPTDFSISVLHEEIHSAADDQAKIMFLQFDGEYYENYREYFGEVHQAQAIEFANTAKIGDCQTYGNDHLRILVACTDGVMPHAETPEITEDEAYDLSRFFDADALEILRNKVFLSVLMNNPPLWKEGQINPGGISGSTLWLSTPPEHLPDLANFAAGAKPGSFVVLGSTIIFCSKSPYLE